MPIRDVVLLRLSAALLALLLSLVAAQVALAQADDDSIGEQRARINELRSQVDALSDRVAESAKNDAELVDIRLELGEVAERLGGNIEALQTRIDSIDARLEQIGTAPGEGQPPENRQIADERARLLETKAEVSGLLGEAEDLAQRVETLIGNITEMRRELFANTLLTRHAISFSLANDAIREFGGEMVRLYGMVASWLDHVFRMKLLSFVVATALALVAAGIIFFGGRRLFGGLVEIQPAIEGPSYLSRLSVAFWSTLVPTLSLGMFFAITQLLYRVFGVLQDDIARVLGAAFVVVLLVFFIYRIANAILMPDTPNWRLMRVEGGAARMLVWLILLMAAVLGLEFFLGEVNEILEASSTVAVGQQLVAALIIGITVILIGLLKPLRPQEDGGDLRPWPTWFRYLLFLLGGTTAASALLGYVGLADFLANQIVVTGAILATMYIGFQSASALSEEGAFAGSALGKRILARWSVNETALDRAGLALSIVINILVVLLGVPLILFQWGFQPGDIQAWFLSFATGIRIGTISISLVGILTGIVVFIVGYIVTRWFQRWLDGKVLARGRVEAGVRNSIRTTVGYAGIALALLIGISAAGVDLSNLALIAGALSLGVGFGLQNIVSNFVSGLILLVERPFKAGDWVVAGAVSGTVKKISVRATEIETFQRQTVILPNSELINAAVGNWTHRNNLGRLEIAVGVAYGSDVRRVHAILMDIATNHPLVLKNPEPFVLFAGFGDSSLDFEIRVFLADILTQLDVLNDIRFAVVEAFEREGIEIPFPQRDIHIKSGPIPMSEVEEQDTADGDEIPEAATPGRRRRRKRPDPE